jgi:hypothetical protein
MKAAAVRILRALHAALGRWLALHPPRSADDEEAEAWDRAHFRNWPGRR